MVPRLRHRYSGRRAIRALACAWVAALPGLGASAAPTAAPIAAPAPASSEELRLHAVTLEHQSASDALALVRPLLSPRGTVELQAGTNTLVVRDTATALARVVSLLRAYDHPSAAVQLDVQVVRAGLTPLSPLPKAATQPVDPALAERLKRLLRFQDYSMIARAHLAPREGDQVTYDLGGGYRLEFRLGTVMLDKRVRLFGFRVVEARREKPERELLHTSVNLWLDQPLVLGLTRDEASPNALLVVVTYQSTAGSP